MWGNNQPDGKSTTAGHGTWKFYDANGVIQLTITSGGAGESWHPFLY